MNVDQPKRERISSLADETRDHFESIEQDVPEHALLVGGAIRDTLLDNDPNDFDFVVLEETQQSMRDKGFMEIDASSFPVFHDSDGQEWALARTEQKTGVGYTDFSWNADGVSLKDDLRRRDLTMNAIALSVTKMIWSKSRYGSVRSEDLLFESQNEWVIFDPFGGVRDIKDRIITHTSDQFSEDPVRLLRVARYASRYPSMRINNETARMMSHIASELNLMSRDRVGMEIEKAMEQAVQPSVFFRRLQETGVLAVLWPDLHRADVIKAGAHQYHAEGTLFDHTMMVLDRMNEICNENGISGVDRVRRLIMAVAHDIGKVVSADKQGGIHSDDPPTRFGGHAEIGANQMKETARRLGLERMFEDAMKEGCEHHMRFHEIPSMPPSELIQFLSSMFPTGATSSSIRTLPVTDSGTPHKFYGATAWELLDLAHADHEGRIQVVDGEERVPSFDRDVFVSRIEAVFEAEQTVDGYEALEMGLCDEHSDSEIDRTHGIHVDEDKSVNAVMSSCKNCVTPGEWVSDELDAMKVSVVSDMLEDG